MSSNFFPMLSSSPPPIGEEEDSPENEDDDFGMYASAHIAFDSSLDSPVSTKSIISKNHYTDGEKTNSVSSVASKTEVSGDKLHRVEVNGDAYNRPSEPDVERCIEDQVKLKISSDSDIDDGCFQQSEEGIGSGFVGNGFKEASPRCSTTDSQPEEQPEDKQTSIYAASESPSVDQSSHDSVPVPKDYVEDRPILAFGLQPAELQSGDSLINDDSGGVCSSEETHAVADDYSEVDTSATLGFDGEVPDTSDVNNIESPNVSDRHSNSVDVTLESHPDSPQHFAKNAPSGLFANKLEGISPPETDLPDLNLPPYPTDNFDGDDDFEDFQDANLALSNAASNVYSTRNNCSGYSETHSKQRDESEEDESFGNFASFEPVVLADETSEGGACGGGAIGISSPDEFADFESCTNDFDDSKFQARQPEGDDDDEDDFANFEAAEFVESVKEPCKIESNEDKVSKVISTVFPLADESQIENGIGLAVDILEQNCKSRRLWDKLHDTDQTPGLPFQWAVSHSFQQLLRSVNVDYHSILRTSTVPFFASGLGLLEPVKGATVTSDSKTIDDQSFDSKPNPIPPVHFDWGSSGLVNPLDSRQGVSVLFDLSFLSSSANASGGKDVCKDFSFENELLKPEPDASAMEPTLKPQILEQLLSSGASSIAESQPSCRPPNLSQEAVHVLDQLPDISFIRAKVLMFPIAGT